MYDYLMTGVKCSSSNESVLKQFNAQLISFSVRKWLFLYADNGFNLEG